jgi:small-conductance mechanosensitive channel
MTGHQPSERFALLMQELTRPEAWVELAVALGCIALAWLLTRNWRGGAGAADESRMLQIGRGGARRIAFPLAAVALLLVGRFVVARMGEHTDLIGIAILLMLAMAVVRLVVYSLRQVFAEALWLANMERSVAAVVWSLFLLHIVGILPEIIEFLESIRFSAGKQTVNLWLILQSIALVVATVLTALWISSFVEARLLAAKGVDGNVRLLLSRLAKTLLVVVGVLLALPMVGLDLTTLSVFGGALGVGLGLGLQRIASNYVSGFIILLDRSIRIGNLVSVGQDTGVVTQITTRYTVLRAFSGQEAIVPNEMLVSNVVTNQAFSDTRIRTAVQVQVSYTSDLERAMTLMTEIARAQPRVLPDPAPAAFLVAFADSGVNLEVGFWVNDPEEGTLGLRSAISLEIWHAFNREGIVIPFPQREIRMLS